MGILFTKMRRDIWYNKGRSFSIIMIVLIATAIYGGLFLSWINITNTYDKLSEDMVTHDVRFQISGVNESSLDLDSIDGIRAWDYRLMMFAGIKIAHVDETFTGVLYGVEQDRQIRVDDVYLLNGSDLRTGTDNSILFATKFFQYHNLNLGDNVTLPNTYLGEYNFSIKAEVFSAEFSYNVNPFNGLPDLKGFPVGWVPLHTLQELFGMVDMVNEVVVRFDPDVVKSEKTFDAKIEEVRDELLKVSPQVSFVKYEDEANTKMKSADVDSLGDIARVFGGVVLLIALFAVYDNVSKLIANQRNYVGTMRALGGSKKRVTMHYTSIASTLGLFGVLLGIPTGWWMSEQLAITYVSILGLPYVNSELILTAFTEAVGINFALVVVIGFLASLSSASIEPREAMSSMYITASYKKRSLVEKMLETLPTFKKPTSKIPLRGLFQKKRRTLLTILTYSISLVLMISSFAMVTTFTVGLDKNFDNYEKYDLQVVFSTPLDPSQVQSVVDSVEGISSYEQYITRQVEVKANGKSFSTQLYAYEINSNLRKLKLRLSSSGDGIVLGSILASDLDVSMDDNVEVFNSTFKVSNLADEMLGGGVYMSIPQAQDLLGYGNNISGYLVKMDGSISEKELKDNLLKTGLPIGLILSSQDVKEGINVMMEGFFAMVGIVMLIGMTIVALFTFNTVVLDAMSREMEFVNLRALGSKRRTLMKIILSQSLFIVIFGSLFAIPIGYYVSDLVNKSLMDGLMVLETVVTPDTYILSIVSAFIASMFGVIAAYRYVIKIDLVDATRKRVNT